MLNFLSKAEHNPSKQIKEKLLMKLTEPYTTRRKYFRKILGFKLSIGKQYSNNGINT